MLLVYESDYNKNYKNEVNYWFLVFYYKREISTNIIT